MNRTQKAIALTFSALAAFGTIEGCGSPAPAPAPKSDAPKVVTANIPDEKGKSATARRNVKTAIDADASKIDTSPKDTTVEEIAAMKPPAGGSLTSRSAPFETSTWRTKATLASVKLMKDGDYYLVMKGDKGGETVVEVPDPKDCKGSPLLPQITATRKKLEEKYHPTTTAKELHDQATVTGVGFLGFGSKKTGRSKVGSRLMPGLDIEF